MIRIPIWVVEGVATVVLAISTQFGFILHPRVSIGHPGVSSKYLSLLHHRPVFQLQILLESCLIGFTGLMANVVDGTVLGFHYHCVVCLIDGATLDQLIGGQHVAGVAGY